MPNIVWEDTQGVQHLDRPFLAYVGKGFTRRFGDWLYGIATNDERGRAYSKRYGNIIPNNLQETALTTSKFKNGFGVQRDKEIIRYLKKMRTNLLNQEKKLYRALKCNDFFGFKQLWDTGALSEVAQTGKDDFKYWMNYHLNFLTGETVRLALEKNYTLIERVLALAAIELQSITTETVEGEGYGKKDLKKALEEEGILELVKDIDFKQLNKKVDIWVPTRGHRGKDITDSAFMKTLLDFFADGGAEFLSDNLRDALIKGLENAIGKQYRTKNIKKRKTKGQKEGRLKNWFTEIVFKSAEKSPATLIALADSIYDFMAKAREYSWKSEEDKNRWRAANRGSALAKKIKKGVSDLIFAYFSHREFIDINKNGIRNNAIQGFFGELAAYGKAYFNLTERGAEVFDIGSFHGKDSGQLLGVDTVLVVKNTPYGIQVKNPFALTHGYYKTYRKSLSLAEEQQSAVKKFFGFSDDEFDQFIMYNLNINNTTTPEKLMIQIEKFMFLYSDQFARLSSEEIAEDLSKYQNTTLDAIQGKSVNNVFFIVKGEIFPSSWIVQGLIEQYNYFINETQKYKKGLLDNKVLIMHYYNDIPKRLITTLSGDENYDETQKYDPQYIPDEAETNNFLARVKFTSYLKLEIPSIQELMDYYKDMGFDL